MDSEVLSMSSKYRDKRTNVCSKAERSCVLLAIGVLSMSSNSEGHMYGQKPNGLVSF